MKSIVTLGVFVAGAGIAYLSACSAIVGISDLPATADGGSGSGSGSSSGSSSSGSSSGGGSSEAAAFLGTWSGTDTESGECNGTTVQPVSGATEIVITQGATTSDLVGTAAGTTCALPLKITNATTAALARQVTCTKNDGNGSNIATTYQSGTFALTSSSTATFQLADQLVYTGALQQTCNATDRGTLSK